MGAEPPLAIALEGVEVTYGAIGALSAVSLAVRRGERVGVIGASGAGKSTLFSVLTRGTRLRAGSVVVGGVDLMALAPRDLRAARRQVGVIYQSYGLVPQLTAGMNVALGELAGGSDRAALRALVRGPEAALSQRVVAALERVGLAERALDRVADLSGGQQQRVAVARLLVQRPALILADEPVSAVDPVTAERVLEALGELTAEGATLLIALHDVALARSFPRVVALRRGSVAFDGPPSELDDDLLATLYAEAPARPAPAGEGRQGVAAEPFALPLDSDGYGLRAR